MNLEPFIYRKVIAKFRDGSSKTGTLTRAHISPDYPYIFDNRFYTKRGEILIDILSKYDIVFIQPAEEPEMTEPNYKEIAEKLYNVIKTIPSLRGYPQYHLVMKEYENATNSKIRYVSPLIGERFVYNGKDYAQIDGFWYRVQKCVLTLVEDNNLKSELIDAYYEWEKNE